MIPGCRKCGVTALVPGVVLVRVNEKGVEGIWECQGGCDPAARMDENQAVINAIEGDKRET